MSGGPTPSAGDDAGSRPSEQTTGATASPSTTAGMTGMDHTHSHGDPLPTDIPAAQDPRYPVGSHVRLTADHMEGMDGAEATVVGAYDTWTYAVDYTPTTGGPEVKDHRWVVQQEIRDIAGVQRTVWVDDQGTVYGYATAETPNVSRCRSC